MIPEWFELYDSASEKPYEVVCTRCGEEMLGVENCMMEFGFGHTSVDWLIKFIKFCQKHSKCGEIMEGDERNEHENLVVNEEMKALWNSAFASFKTAANATKINDISGGEFDRAARMYEDFEKITASLKRRIKT